MAASIIDSDKLTGSAKYCQYESDLTQAIKVIRFQLLCNKQILDENVPEASAGKSTHVVTGVRYGVQAFCVFHRYLCTHELKEDVEEEMESTLNEFIKAIEYGENQPNFSEFESKIMKAKFYGDLHDNPRDCSISEAFDLICKMKQKIEQDPGKTIRVTVWLKPLDKSNLLRDLDDDILDSCLKYLGGIGQIKNKLLTLLKEDEQIKPFLLLRESLRSFANCLVGYTQLFRRHLHEQVESIRSGQQDNQTIIQLLNDVDAGLFQSKKLYQLFQQKCDEIRAWRIIAGFMQDRVPLIQTQAGKDAALFNVSSPWTVVLLLPKMDQQSERLLKDMKNYVVKNRKIVRIPPSSSQLEEEVAPWYSVGNIRHELLKTARRMFQQMDTNAEDAGDGINSVSFIMTMLIENCEPYRPKLVLFKDGHMINEDFQLPSPPTGLQINFKKSVPFLEWECESSKDVDFYVVQFEVIDGSNWSCRSTNSADQFVDLRFVQDPSGYQLRVAAVCVAGRSKFSAIYQQIVEINNDDNLQLEIPQQYSALLSSVGRIQVQQSLVEKFQNLFD